MDPLPGPVLREAREAHGWSLEEAQRGVGFDKVTTGIEQVRRWENAGPDFQPRSPLYRKYVKKLGLSAPAAEAVLQVTAERYAAIEEALAEMRTELAVMSRGVVALLPADRRRALGIDEAQIDDWLDAWIGRGDVA